MPPLLAEGAGPGAPGHVPAAGAFDPMSLTWSERYGDGLEKVWARLPRLAREAVVTLSVFCVGLAMSGDWLLVLVHFRKQIGLDLPLHRTSASWTSDFANAYFKDLGYFWIMSILVSYSVYFGMGGFLHWYFYVRQRERAEEWKIQPGAWPSAALERQSIRVGSLSLVVTSTFSALLSCYVKNGGWSMVYYSWDEYGVAWFLLQTPVIFLFQDYVTYWLHRMYHTPFLYRHFHKVHHAYKHPTAFSTTAFHPIEVLHIQMTVCIPLFVVPVHWALFYALALYTYYHGIIVHSGINFKAHWWQPWQPAAVFHDNHHQYFHVNFGSNCWMWDTIHDTCRRKDRLYTENTFYGRGKPLTEASKDEIARDLEERRSENPKAHRDGKPEFVLSDQEVAALQSKSKVA